ncbi:hypothetical protein [Tomitella biformata]|uniref:hypothetical protein n=1 Tax=Tomitella biformata TaxID=630403 RepID=UPI0004645C73|nr:hypothetical protein [Tomitella biformata]
MTSLVTLLNTDTTLWAGALLGLIIGSLVGVFATMALTRRGRRRGSSPTEGTAPDLGLRESYLAFIEAADSGHNSLLSVDRKDLEDVELEDALESDNPGVRKLAQSILTLASLHNELRLSAPKDVLACAETLFEFLTHSAMDGVKDRDGFSDNYQGHKSEFIAAARKTFA